MPVRSGSKLRTHATPALLAAFAFAGVMALGSDQALANHVACGDEITADTTLDSDLVDCPSNGIVIGADDITLDLDGHRVDGDGTEFAACPADEFCDTGLLNDGHDGVTVKDGSVREFGVGVFIGKARHNRVLRISSTKNVFFGFVIARSARSLIRDSSGSGNPAPEGDGLGLFDSHHIRILHNSFRHNGLGIHLGDSPDNLIRRNRISRNSDFGILIEADRNRVRRNRCARNAACIIIAPGSGNVIARNRVSGGHDGIGVEKGRDNVVARNVVDHARGNGIYVGLQRPPIGGADNVVRRNLVRGSGDDGFSVNKKDHHSLLRHNVAKGAGDDGFDIESASTKLTGNRAVRNGDLGIEAVRGLIDGGGNAARHNGDPRQCTHIFCR
ncbi:MAG: right-handed parallel beta-helix repeat-containing protein [Actinomycetota bacterium]|nr:right-handed parallel beta-helix repeat-containing protein [Actinomycetota bacterium]